MGAFVRTIRPALLLAAAVAALWLARIGHEGSGVAAGAPHPASDGSRAVLIVQGTRVNAKAGMRLNHVLVGSVSDVGPGTPAPYKITIDWGDGPGQAVTPADAPHGGARAKTMLIMGSHTYRTTGVFPINVTISAADRRAAYLTSIAQVNP